MQAEVCNFFEIESQNNSSQNKATQEFPPGTVGLELEFLF